MPNGDFWVKRLNSPNETDDFWLSWSQNLIRWLTNTAFSLPIIFCSESWVKSLGLLAGVADLFSK